MVIHSIRRRVGRVPLLFLCPFRYYLKGGGGDVFPLLPPPKSRGCGFSYGPDFFLPLPFDGVSAFSSTAQ